MTTPTPAPSGTSSSRAAALTLAALLLAFALAFAPRPTSALTPPPDDSDYAEANATIFLTGEVTRVDITIDAQDFQDLLDNPDSNEKKSVTMRWRNSVIDETLEQVGFRPRGGAFTRGATRKSWKLDFNDFVPDRSFHTLEEVDLNGEHNDPTFLRRAFAHEILRQMGLPVSRTHFVALYINDAFWSIQIHTEAVDEEFADSWFGNKDGNLFKCTYEQAPADLRKIDGEDYESYGGGSYEEQNNDPGSDYTDLVEFIRLLNDTTAAERLDQLEASLHTDNVLRYFASNVVLGSWDDYWYGSNNFYLYNNDDTGRFELIPYDYDNSVGMDYFNTNWSTRDFDGWGDGGFGSTPAPMVDALFDHSPWRRQYRRYLADAADLVTAPENQALLDAWKALLDPYYDGTIESGGAVGTASSSGEHDPYYETGIDEPVNWDGSSYHTMGLKPFLDARAASLALQLGGFSTPDLPRVFVNEAIATNTDGLQDEMGQFEDWIELYNDEETEVDISGWHLSDDVTDPLKWTIPADTTIAAKSYLVVFCDNEPTDGPLHATYGLSSGGENIGLFMNTDEGRVLVDYFPYPALAPDVSYGRTTDGGDEFTEMCVPTPGLANDPTGPPCETIEPRTPPLVFINEFMADNDNVIADEMGEFDDWVELYNDEETEVDLSGLYLSDDLLDPTKWQFPKGTTIPAKGFLLIWADNDTAQGPLHASFALGAGGEEIGLFDNDENLRQPIHTTTFGAQTTDVSVGLFPDGTEPFVVQTTPTPGASNIVVPRDPPRLFINEFMADNDTVIADEMGEFDDWVEIYNDEDAAVDLSGMYMSDDLLEPNKWQIPDGTTIAAKGFLLIWADNDTEQGPLHSAFALGAGGEEIGLFDNDNNLRQAIHTTTFGAQTTDVSIGLLPDGVEPFVVQSPATPGASNVSDPPDPTSWAVR